jgi:Flp pilus assembly protein TadD
MGLLRLFADWDMEAAYTECQKALSTSPGSARVRHAWAILLQASGEAAKAVEELEAAVQLDPLSPVMVNALGQAMFHAGRFEDALRTQDRVMEIDPSFRAALDAKGWIFILQRRYQEAATQFARVLELTGDPYKGLSSRGFAAAKLGRPDETRRALEMLGERKQRNAELHLEVDFLLLHYALGDMESAAEYFEALVRRGAVEVMFMATDPLWRVLRAQPDFRTALERRGLAGFTLAEFRARRSALHGAAPTARTPTAPAARYPSRAAVASPSRAPATSTAGPLTGVGASPQAAAENAPVLFGVFGTIDRRGVWTPAARSTAVVILGGGTLDFREATLHRDVTEIDVFMILGGMEVIVPPHVRVEWTGTAIAGDCVQGTPAPEAAPANARVIRIGGFIMLGAVTTHVRYAGETEEDANRRANRP